MYSTKPYKDMFNYEFDYETMTVTAYEDGASIATLDINTDRFEDMDREEMSDGVIEMHCDEMMKVYERYMQNRRDMENDINQ